MNDKERGPRRNESAPPSDTKTSRDVWLVGKKILGLHECEQNATIDFWRRD